MGRRQQSLRELQAEYVRLFINPLPEVPRPPYASVYLEGTLMGVTTVRLAKLYAGYGRHTEEIPDHLDVELEFPAMLADLGPDGNVDEDRCFLWNHI